MLPENQIIVPGQEKLFVDTPVEVSTPDPNARVAIQPETDKAEAAFAGMTESQGGENVQEGNETPAV